MLYLNITVLSLHINKTTNLSEFRAPEAHVFLGPKVLEQNLMGGC